MDCTDAHHLLPRHMDGELDEAERRRMEAHLDSCAACRREAEALTKSWEMLGELDEIEPNPFYVSRFFARVAEQTPRPAKLAGFLESLLAPRRLIPLLAAAGLVIFITISAHQILHRTDTAVAENQLFEADPEMVESIEVAENFDLINELDFLSDLELIQGLDGIGV